MPPVMQVSTRSAISRPTREYPEQMTTQQVAVTPGAGGDTASGDAAAGRPMRADARRNYQRVLVAAREVLAERGGEATMEEIAKRADVGVGTLYRHFPRRIDLVEAVYREDVDLLVALANQVSDADPWDAL